MKGIRHFFIALTIVLTAIVFLPLLESHASAAVPVPSDFSLQVSPSPLVATVKPGQATTLELKIRNAGSGAEELKIEPRSFAFDSKTGRITIDDTSTTEITKWVSFSAASFTVKPREWYTQKVTINVPPEAGFSYHFTLIISRQNNPRPVAAGRLIKGSVAVFTLVNIDRPGATRKLEVTKFATTKRLYEYLPATVEVTFKNTGNTIVQPYGNIFIQRKPADATPLTTLKVNENGSYILPGTSRTITADWQEGFPVYQKTAAADSKEHRTLIWNWDHASDFRIGRYVAKLDAAYNDGNRDILLENESGFWVIPWKAILVVLAAITALIFFSRWRNKRRTAKAVKRALEAQKSTHKDASVTSAKGAD
jgi:hypothetical protein